MAVTGDLYIEILSRRETWSVDDGRAIFQSWLDLVPLLTPERCGPTEPVRYPFTLDTVLANWSSWSSFLLALRKKPSLWMMIFLGLNNKHSSLSINLDARMLARHVRTGALTEFLKSMAAGLAVDFGYVHLLTEGDVPRGLASEAVRRASPDRLHYDLFVTTHLLRRYLPQVFWATVLGDPYVRLFGRSTLLSAPAYQVEELPDGAVYIQLSESPLDLRSRFAEVDAVRCAVETHLNHNAFFDAALHPMERNFTGRSIPEIEEKRERWFGTHRYDVPVFQFDHD